MNESRCSQYCKENCQSCQVCQKFDKGVSQPKVILPKAVRCIMEGFRRRKRFIWLVLVIPLSKLVRKMLEV